MTKLRFFFDYALTSDGKPSLPLWRSNEVVDEVPGKENPYSKYLAAFLYGFVRPLWIAEVEKKISQLEAGELASFQEATDGLFAIFSRDVVEIGMEISYRWTEVKQEDWEHRFTLQEFKSALEGWKRFLDMPVNLESEVVVELSAHTNS